MPISPAAVSSSAMHGAVVPIAQAVGNGATSSFAFNNIPQNFQDLMFVVYQRDATGGNSGYGNSVIQFNGVGGTSYSTTSLYGNGSSASSGRVTNNNGTFGVYGIGSATTAGVFTSSVVHILNYANTSTFKTVLSRGAVDINGSGETDICVNLFSSTNAIRSLTIFGYSGNPATGSTFTLYGIRTVGQ
jgi:hypothetical protein